jgi:putative ABC transport system permease protein
MGVGNVRPAHFRILGHLQDGVSLEAAESDLTPVFQQYQARHPKDYPEKIVIHAKNFIESVVGELRSTLVALMFAVSLLLLIACCNVANLLLARATVREKEIAIRAAIGAGRLRLIREILIEGVLLAAASCAAGCLFAYGGVRLVARMLPPYVVPTEANISINSSVLILALCVAFLTMLLCANRAGASCDGRRRSSKTSDRRPDRNRAPVT